jgi:hypothetical protein
MSLKTRLCCGCHELREIVYVDPVDRGYCAECVITLPIGSLVRAMQLPLTNGEPRDPEGDALNRIIEVPAGTLLTSELREELQRYCLILDLEGVFAGLSWGDARMVADAVSFDFTTRTTEDAVWHLRNRARKVLGGWEDWDDRTSAVRALNLAAAVLEDWEGVQ